MKTYKIEIELVLKDTADIEDGYDFIYATIQEQLEVGESIDWYDVEEKKPKPYTCEKFEPMTEN
jgi:hypothetical protein